MIKRKDQEMIDTVRSMDECLMHQWRHCESLTYRLHSRFSHAINWMNDENDMITLLSENLPNGPNTLIVDIQSFDDWRLHESSVLTYSSQGLSLSQSNINIMIREDVQLWHEELPRISKVNDNVMLTIHQFLSLRNGELQTIEKTIYDQLDDNHRALCKAIHAKNYEDVIQCVQRNIGLGLGLTPSGDDRLVGFLLGCYIQSRRNIDLLEAIQKAIVISHDRTNDISYAMLKCAAEGRFNEWLMILSEVICQHNQDALNCAIENVFSIGSRSGGDMLKGFVLSLELFR